MVSKKAALVIAISVIASVGLLHGLTHAIIFGTGIPKLLENGAGRLNLYGMSLFENYSQKYFFYSLPSKISLALELCLLIFLSFTFSKISKKALEDEKMLAQLKEKYTKIKHTTDLDVLYNMLKEKKRIEIGAIPKLFKISKSDAENWSEILESGSLALIHSPKIGDRELILNE